MSLVVDASVVVAALVDSGAEGRWALDVLGAGGLAAPALMPYEVANVLRRIELSGRISADVATLAHADLVTLPVDLAPYVPCATRSWALRPALTAYDASYVALAEALDVPLATLDARLARAPGVRCAVHLPG